VGFPALSLPCGFAGKLPVAIQLVGMPYSENMLIAIGKQYQTNTTWHRRRPDV
jgi:aspartyl-tRNA(Asn)/glutamyl-tRNA(Gln) amidotransferase subunit A